MEQTKRLVREIAETVGVTLALFLFLVAFVAQGYQVFGSCMEPNLRTGERLVGNKFVYLLGTPSRGDVIVFRYPHDPRRVYVKRVVGLPGETVEIHRGTVFIDGRPLDEHAYVKREWVDDLPRRTIPKGTVFVLGDNRNESDDSRYWGELPLTNVIAKAWFRYWPVSRAALLR